MLKINTINTPLGRMLIVGDEKEIYAIEFEDALKGTEGSGVVLGKTDPMRSIESELNQYFEGKIKQFHTPIKLEGSSFQKDVWINLQKIPFGKTCSYSEIARMIQNSKAVRAVGTANGKNRLAIVVPCHRVINANGGLGGYSSGLERKKWLLSHEGKYARA